MSTESSNVWPPLPRNARRVLGVLIEKAKTTPDTYPLSLNGLVTGCNQKSNRDPLLELADHDVEDAMAELKRLGYAQQVIGGGRVDKYRHVVYEAWRVSKTELAILGELLLRGPQSIGDLRTRASRMEPIADLELLRADLRNLASRGLVVWLTPEERRGALVTHGFHEPHELERLQSQSAHRSTEGSEGLVKRGPGTNVEERLAHLEVQVAELREELAALRAAGHGGNPASASHYPTPPSV